VQGSPQWTRGIKKLGKKAISKSKGDWNTKLHVVSADDKAVVEPHTSPVENVTTVPIAFVGEKYTGVPLLMDRAYAGDETRAATGMSQLFRRRKNRKNPWEYDKEKYKRRNVVERLFSKIERI
jgi:transposase